MFADRSRRHTAAPETNAGKPWDSADLFFLISGVERGLSIEEVAGFLRRPASEVQEKASCRRGRGGGAERPLGVMSNK
jgi:hypothetical protein